MRIKFAAGFLGPRLLQRALGLRAAMGEAVFRGTNGVLAPLGRFTSPPQIDDFAHLSTRRHAPPRGFLRQRTPTTRVPDTVPGPFGFVSGREFRPAIRRRPLNG